MRIIKRSDSDFPSKLLNINPPVEQIYVEGDENILNKFGIAVIGSRNSSKEGEKITDEFVAILSRLGINIISGFAKGIDSKAHRSCIESGGKTIAVLGSGFNNIYPKENTGLYKRIIETGGAIVSEYSPNTEVLSVHFPQRNRIVSGLSDGILMIEGKNRSGTTITAKCGLKQGKPVFCMPHSIYNTYGTGPNRIIQIGGNLITSVKDIVDYFKGNGVQIGKEKKTNSTRKEKNKYNDDILRLLSEEILTKEELAQRTNNSISEINQRITILELEGVITEEFGKGYRIIEY